MSDLPTASTPAKPTIKYIGEPPKKKSHAVLWTVIVVIVLGLGFVAWHARASQGAGAKAGGRRGPGGFGGNGPVPVVARPAVKANLNVVLNLPGTVTPLATVTIRTQISGQLVQVNFAEGQLVNKGDLLAVIDPRPYQAALEQAQGQLLQAQAQLKEGQIDLERYQTLSTQDSISKQQVDSQQALVSQYEGMTKTDQAAVDNAQLNLTYCHITAPFTGRVGLRLVDQGNYVTPGDATGLVLLTQVKPISVIYSLAERYIPEVQKRIKSGDTIRVDAYNSDDSAKISTGKLGTIDNTVDTTTGQFKLRALFANDDEALFPNQFVTVHMLLDVDMGATVIPTSAVERGQQGTFVYVVGADNKVAAKTVKLGDTEGERVSIVSGINVGDKVVVDGADRLKDGSEILLQAGNRGGQAGAGKAGDGQAQGSGDGTHKHWKANGASGGDAAPADGTPTAQPKPATQGGSSN
ncbi:MAG TPA: efflux RND transporter periplasmic adaptor subunit [Opitutaceae bacterium]|jgi:multidrug efflux system membrane fusion protein|nr:efflux RND transporter periplasmic adaptor subunit [Opitutaceae bacterium]